jgi:pimeloyl-ACP methyl ester carboxylesterase
LTSKAPWLPPGRALVLPGRGTTFVRHHPAPPGAPTVLLLHGLGVTADVQWFTAYPALVERYGVVALDHRGHGRGLRSREPFTLEDCADDAAAALTELGVDRAVVVGYSMGGPVAQVFWRRHPDRTAGLVLCAGVHSYRGMEPSSGRRPAVAAAVRALKLARFLAARIEPGLRRWLLTQLARSNHRYVYDAGVALGAHDATAWLTGVEVPHAVVITELDVHVPPDRQRLVASALPAATVLSCQADHVDTMAQPNPFVPVLVEALDAVTAPTEPTVS